MGSKGALKAGRRAVSNNVPPERETVTDDYGRTYPIVELGDVPEGYKLWVSGTWQGVGADFNNGYAVFAPRSGYSVDTDNGVVVRVSGSDAGAIMSLGGTDEDLSSAKAESYIKRYDKPSAGRYTRRKVQMYKDALPALRRLGL